MKELSEAKFYQRQIDGSVVCQLCPHRCHIESGGKGVCQVRENQNGILYTSTYGRLTNKSIDPVEKKPFFHFHPGSKTYSISSFGCNLRCPYCINFAVSQMPNDYSSDLEEYAADAVVTEAKDAGCNSIAYTYVEPAIFYEYIDEVARLAHAAGLLNIFKTNGFISPELIEASSSYIDAANVDLKTFSEVTYQGFGGRLGPILENLRLMKGLGIWIEITTVIIPDVNDSVRELKAMARFVAQDLGVDTPWHIARFFPAYKLAHSSPTPIETLERARQIGFDEGLRYVYLSNVPLTGYQDTVCPMCSQLLIRRHGITVLESYIKDDRCCSCGAEIAGVGLAT